MGWFPSKKITYDIERNYFGYVMPKLIILNYYKLKFWLKIYSYPEILYSSHAKTRVVIGGSLERHMSMILHVMHYHNIAVDFMVGAT
jgi:UDP-N-acetylmuramate: L-alanyl-gamma-D-glutamyl-meso-diaminopimelate ligase